MLVYKRRGFKVQSLYLKASSAVIVPSTSYTVKACHSWKKENALSFEQVEQMLFNFMKQKQTWKSNYSTVRLFFLFWSSLNFPSVFLCIMGCVIWPVGRFLVHFRSSFLPLYVNLFPYFNSIKVLTKLLWNYAACARHLFNRSAPYSGGSRPSDKGGGGAGHPDPELGGGLSPKQFFSALRASVWSNNKGGQPPWAPPLDRPLP